MRILRWLRSPELIGAPDCPILKRWTIIAAESDEALLSLPKWATRDRKLMVHHFMPNTEDRDPHDHPRGFWTFVFRGGYVDLVPCRRCDGTGVRLTDMGEVLPMIGGQMLVPCDCDEGLVVCDRMETGTWRYRPATHTHITLTDPRGAWTVVVMGPFARPWGFLREGRWWPFRKYEEEFGFAMRCPSDEDREGAILKYTDDGVVARGR